MITLRGGDHHARARWVVYTATGLLVLGLLAVMLLSYRGHPDDPEAREKAQQVTTALTAAGYDAPSEDTLVGLFGDDGGAVCTSPGGTLATALTKQSLANGAGGPGLRPVTVDQRSLDGVRLIIKTYCPDQLATFDDFVADLKFADVAKA